MEKIKVDDLIKLSKEDLKGKLVCFPTDTVYGLGGLYGDEEVIKKIYDLKRRPLNKPISNLCSSVEQIRELGIEIPEQALKLIDQYWPGALTLIFSHEDSKISFRIPNCEVTLKMLDKFSIFMNTSVNISGKKELNRYKDIKKYFGDHIDYFIEDEVKQSFLPSTVVDVTGDELIVLRQGSVLIKNQ